MRIWQSLGVLVWFTFVAACSDHALPPPPPGPGGGSGGTSATGGSGGFGATGGTGGMGATGGTGGTDATGGAGGMGGNAASGGTGGGGAGTAGAGGRGACLSEADIDAIVAQYPVSARQIAAECGEGCPTESDDQAFLNCTNLCIDEKIPGLSDGCTSCYGSFSLCLGVTCRADCASDACVTECETCQGYDTCFQNLARCAGRDSQDCGD